MQEDLMRYHKVLISLCESNVAAAVVVAYQQLQKTWICGIVIIIIIRTGGEPRKLILHPVIQSVRPSVTQWAPYGIVNPFDESIYETKCNIVLFPCSLGLANCYQNIAVFVLHYKMLCNGWIPCFTPFKQHRRIRILDCSVLMYF